MLANSVMSLVASDGVTNRWPATTEWTAAVTSTIEISLRR